MCEIKIESVDDKILLEVDGVELKGRSLSEDVDLGLKSLFDIVAWLGAVINVVSIVEEMRHLYQFL